MATPKLKVLIVLDVEMPKMDGVTFLRNLMRLRPMPVVDEATSVVWGMPREAVAIGAAVQVMGLQEIPARLRALAESMDVTRSNAAV